MKIARSFNCGFDAIKFASPGGAAGFHAAIFSAAPAGLDLSDGFYPQLKLRAILGCPFGTKPAAESAECLLKVYDKGCTKPNGNNNALTSMDKNPRTKKISKIIQ